MVKIGLVKIFVAVEWIEHGRQSNKSAHSHESKNDAVFSEKAFAGNDRFIGIATFGNQITVTVDIEVQHKAEDYWVNLEMNSKTEEESSNHVTLMQYQINRYQHEGLNDLVIRATATHCKKCWVKDQC